MRINPRLFGMTLKLTLKHGGGDTFISFKILKDLMLVQKQTVNNMKALILRILEPENKGVVCTIREPSQITFAFRDG